MARTKSVDEPEQQVEPEKYKYVTLRFMPEHFCNLEDMLKTSPGTSRQGLVWKAVKLAGYIASLRLSGIAHFGYLDKEGKFHYFQTFL